MGENAAHMHRVSRILPIALFAISLIAAFYLTITMARFFVGGAEDQETKAIDFSDSFVVSEQNDVLRIAHDPVLNPEIGKDFLLWSVFMLRKPLELGERAVFIGKYDLSEKTRPGYALGLIRLQDGVHPIIYWQDDKNVGRWFTFSVGEFPARSWLFMALSFRKGTVLGVHGGPLDGVNVLGGYHLDEPIHPNSSSDLVAGAFGTSKFRGRLGVMGILQSPDLSASLVTTVDNLTARPDEFPRFPGRDQVKLWARGSADQSTHHHPVETKGRRAAEGTRNDTVKDTVNDTGNDTGNDTQQRHP